MKIVLIDDDALDLKQIKELLNHLDCFDIVSFNNPLKALKYIKTEKVDLIFSDIDMPEINGIDLFKNSKVLPPIVFCSSYPEFAVRSFEVAPLHFLVKPIKVENLLTVFERLKTDKSLTQDESEKDFIFINENKTYRKIELSSVCFVKAEQNYVRLFTKEGKYLVLTNLSRFLTQLPDNKSFMRVHKSYAVNLNNIQSYQTGFIETFSGEIPVSLAFKDELTAFLKQRTIHR